MKSLIFMLVAIMTGALITGVTVGRLSARIDTLTDQFELIRTMDDYTHSLEDSCE